MRGSRLARYFFGGGLPFTILSCSDYPPLPEQPLVTSNSIAVFGEEGTRVCAGSLRRWERHNQVVFQSLSTSDAIPEGVDVLLTPDPSEFCEGAQGCTFVGRSPILSVSVQESVEHELTHAIQELATDGTPAPWLLEGFARAWSDELVRMPKYPIMLDILAETSWEVDYSGAGHFVRWAYSEMPKETFRTLLVDDSRQLSKRIARLEEALGLPIESILRKYWQEAPLFDPGDVDCSDVRVQVGLDRPRSVAGQLDCGAPSTEAVSLSPDGGLVTRFAIEVRSAGSYIMSVDVGQAVLLPCETISDPVKAAFWAHVAEARALPAPLSSYAKSRVYTLDPGRYLVSIARDSPDRSSFVFSARPNYQLSRLAFLE